MSDAETQNLTELAPIRRGGLVDRKSIAEEFGVSPFTVARWEARGCPVIRLGALRLHDMASTTAWVRSFQTGSREAPRRGRPRKVSMSA